MRDVDNGYILRYTHANVASFFFIFLYAQFNFTNLFINLFPSYGLTHSGSCVLASLFSVTRSGTLLNFAKDINYNSNNPYKILKKRVIGCMLAGRMGRRGRKGRRNHSQSNNYKEKFFQWFTGFSDAEA